MQHSTIETTTLCRNTTGDVPAKLVGASTTVVGSKLYLYGGRLATGHKILSDLYVLDLETFFWKRAPISPEDDVPRARFFHSANAWNNHLIIFGGMSNEPGSINSDELCALNDVRFFDLSSGHWLPSPRSARGFDVPRARYAHLSSVTANRLFIIGGEDFNNTLFDDIYAYDILGKTWDQQRGYPRHCGTYHSVAVTPTMLVQHPQEEIRNSQSSSAPGPPRHSPPEHNTQSPPEVMSSEALIHLPYSVPPSEDHPNDIYLYSNYNFPDIRRTLEGFSPLSNVNFTIQGKSAPVAGTTFPPLRFPTGAILGTHLIIAGADLADSSQPFSIWALDLTTMAWSWVDPGKAIESGSWSHGNLWAEANKFLIFGNHSGDQLEDYNRWLLNWDHVVVVDLEAFGIYQPPLLKQDIRLQEDGLAALAEHAMTDFEIICEDGRRIPCSRGLLEERWPWFKAQRALYLQNVMLALGAGPPEVSGTTAGGGLYLDPRLSRRTFELSEQYPIALALLQYFYTYALITPLQHAPAVLGELLLLATDYNITHLASLVKHAMHRALSRSTSMEICEVATLSECRSLRIRALKTVLSRTSKESPRTRGEQDEGGRRMDESRTPSLDSSTSSFTGGGWRLSYPVTPFNSISDLVHDRNSIEKRPPGSPGSFQHKHDRGETLDPMPQQVPDISTGDHTPDSKDSISRSSDSRPSSLQRENSNMQFKNFLFGHKGLTLPIDPEAQEKKRQKQREELESRAKQHQEKQKSRLKVNPFAQAIGIIPD